MLLTALKKYWLQILLALLLIADLGYSTQQHLHKALDGDLVAIALPAPHYAEVLTDPIGIKVLNEGEGYSGAGRFWAYFVEHKYFHHVPQLLQKYMSPISSIYAAPALLKIATQLLLTFLLAGIVSGTSKFWSKDLLIAAVIISPFFIAGGHYYENFAIIDSAITYVIAYPLMIAVLLLYYSPFFIATLHNRPFQLHWLQMIALGIVAATVSFSGPLIQPIVILISITTPIVYLYSFKQSHSTFNIKAYFKHIPRSVIVYLGVISSISVYAYYIGSYNTENINNTTVSLLDRYGLLLTGLWNIINPLTGYTAVFVFVGINWYLVFKHKDKPYAKTLLITYTALSLFVLLYLLLLPMGGYRAYRPTIIRRDTLIPINLILTFIYSSSSLFLVKQYAGKVRAFFITSILLFCGHLLAVDHMADKHYRCERWLIEMIADAESSPIKINSDCPVLSWGNIHKPENSANNAKMLELWNVTEGELLYYQDP